MLYFNVVSDTFSSKFIYLIKRILIRVSSKFAILFFIAIILAFIITFVYYKYISKLLKLEERKILNLLKRAFKPLFRKKRKEELSEHDLFIQRQLKKKKKRQRTLEIFGGEGIKEKDDEKKKVPKDEPEGGYVMWPPKSKKDEKQEKIFDDLSKLK